MAIIPADVTRMLRGTAGWLSAALPQFDPHRPSREVYSNFAPAKAFAELSFLNRDMHKVVEPGNFKIMIGGNSVDLIETQLHVVEK